MSDDIGTHYFGDGCPSEHGTTTAGAQWLRTAARSPYAEIAEAQAKGRRAAELEHADRSKPMYEGTRFLTLCTLDDRRGGEVTVGESRLPVAPILAVIRAHGQQEAAVMWPQLTTGELAVLSRLVADIDQHDTDNET